MGLPNIQDMQQSAYNMARNKILNQYNYIYEFRLASFLREQNWWNIKVKFKQKIYAEETEADMDGDFIFRWLSITYQVAFQDNRPTIIGFGETIITRDWTDGYDF